MKVKKSVVFAAALACGILLAVLIIFRYKDEDFYFINHKG